MRSIGSGRRRDAATCLSSLRLGETQTQRVELDEALGIALIVYDVLLERDMREDVEGFRRFTPDHPDMALVELEADRALDVVLALVDQGLEHLALRGEPETVIDELGITRHQLVLEMGRAAVERDALDAAMGALQDGAAGGFIDATRFHPDEAVLDQIQPTD